MKPGYIGLGVLAVGLVVWRWRVMQAEASAKAEADAKARKIAQEEAAKRAAAGAMATQKGPLDDLMGGVQNIGTAFSSFIGNPAVQTGFGKALGAGSDVASTAASYL